MRDPLDSAFADLSNDLGLRRRGNLPLEKSYFNGQQDRLRASADVGPTGTAQLHVRTTRRRQHLQHLSTAEEIIATLCSAQDGG